MAGESSESNHNSQELLEKLAEVEHEQWIHYSKDISDKIMNAKTLGELQKDVKEKWFANWIEYSQLSEEEKVKDRIWAEKVLAVLKTYYGK